MKESKVFLGFFKQNIVIIFISALLTPVCLVSFFYYQPNVWEAASLHQFKYDELNINQRVIETDQAVSVLRSNFLPEKLGIPEDVEINVYKPGPLGVQITTRSISSDKSKIALQLLNSYLEANFPVEVVFVGNSSIVDKRLEIIAILSFCVGAVLGVFISLVKTYLKNF